MSKTASYIKDKYNAKTYDRYTFYIRKDDALNTCIQADKIKQPISEIMKNALSLYYQENVKQIEPVKKTLQKTNKEPNYTTKRQRRAAIKKVIKQIEQIKAVEEEKHDNTPDNLQSAPAYEAAEECISFLDEALESLGSAY